MNAGKGLFGNSRKQIVHFSHVGTMVNKIHFKNS